jgi:hypothetical protein
MSPSGRSRLDPAAAARWVRRATWLIALLGAVWLFAVYGTAWVPPGMHTVPEAPPGSWCVLDHRAGAVAVGRDVFFEGPEGVRLFSRIATLDEDSFTVHNPDPDAPWPDSRVFGALPRSKLRGSVLVVFPSGENDRGR